MDADIYWQLNQGLNLRFPLVYFFAQLLQLFCIFKIYTQLTDLSYQILAEYLIKYLLNASVNVTSRFVGLEEALDTELKWLSIFEPSFNQIESWL